MCIKHDPIAGRTGTGETAFMTPWDEHWPDLRRGDVFPVPLATDTHWTADGWEVEVVVLLEVSAGGYSSSPVWSYREPYRTGADHRPDDTSPAAADRVTRAALHGFATRLRELLQ